MKTHHINASSPDGEGMTPKSQRVSCRWDSVEEKTLLVKCAMYMKTVRSEGACSCYMHKSCFRKDDSHAKVLGEEPACPGIRRERQVLWEGRVFQESKARISFQEEEEVLSSGYSVRLFSSPLGVITSSMQKG